MNVPGTRCIRVPAPASDADPIEHARRVLRVHVEVGEWHDVVFY